MAKARDLGERIADIANQEGITYHRGKVVSVTGHRASVYIDGDESEASPLLTALSPVPLFVGQAVEMLAVGDGDFLILGPSYDIAPLHVAIAGSNQSITSASTWQEISFAAPDVDGGWGSGTGLVAPTAGIYTAHLMGIAQSVSGVRTIFAISTSGGSDPFARDDVVADANHWRTIGGTVSLSQGDAINAWVWTATTGANVHASTRLSIARIG